MNPLILFRMGLNTLQIAERLGKTEAEIERHIHIERSLERNCDAKFEGYRYA